jgi:hypothetical protein
MPRIVQYASDCTAPLSQALGKFRHSVMIPIDQLPSRGANCRLPGGDG